MPWTNCRRCGHIAQDHNRPGESLNACGPLRGPTTCNCTGYAGEEIPKRPTTPPTQRALYLIDMVQAKRQAVNETLDTLRSTLSYLPNIAADLLPNEAIEVSESLRSLELEVKIVQAGWSVFDHHALRLLTQIETAIKEVK